MDLQNQVTVTTVTEVTMLKKLTTVRIVEPQPKELPCANTAPWTMFSWSLSRVGIAPQTLSGLNLELRLKNHTRNLQGARKPAVASDYEEVRKLYICTTQ